MKKNFPFALAAALVISLASSPAVAGCRLVSCGFIVAGNSALPVISMNEMQGGRWTVEVAPAYWTLKSDTGGQNADIKPKGFAGAFAVKREFSPRWGLAIIGAKAAQQGDTTLSRPTKDLLVSASRANTAIANGAGQRGGTVKDVGGSFYGLVATYDFFGEKDATFRLPFSFGVSHVTNKLSFETSYANAGTTQTETFKLDKSGLGALVNLSADFIVWDKKLRVSPGIYINHGLSYIKDAEYKVTRSNGFSQTITADESATNVAIASYVALSYRPWDLGFTWNFTQDVAGGAVASNSIYSLHWQKRFGGS
jgi:hypothetical protein